MRYRLTFWVVVVLWPVSLLLYTTIQFRSALEQRTESARIYLDSVAHLKVEHIASWMQELRTDLKVMSGSPLLRKALQEPIGPEVAQNLQAKRTDYRYLQIYLVRVDTEATIGAGANALDARARKLAQQAATTQELALGEASLGPDGHYQFPLARPVVGPWVLLAVADLDAGLDEIFSNWPGPALSGETLMVERRGDDVWFLTRVREAPRGTVEFRLPLSLPNLPAANALRGRTGYMEGIDYRGRAVCASLLRVPGTPWCLVAKLDRGEALDLPGLYRDAAVTVGAGALLWLVMWVALWAYHRSRFYQNAYALELQVLNATTLTRAILEQAPDMIIVLDSEGMVVAANPSAQAFYGLQPGHSGLDKVLDRAQLEAGLREQQQFPARLRGVPLELILSPLEGQPSARLLAVVRSLEERTRLEEQRDRLIQRLDKTNQEMESILYVTSHDLRSPLVNIQGFAERIERGLQWVRTALDRTEIPAELAPELAAWFEDKFPRALGFIKTSTEKMDTLISGLLKVSRAGRAPLTLEELDMEALMRSVADAQAHQLEAVGASLQVGSLPVCWGDRAALNQVFSNLLDNAIKYRSPDRPLKVEISGEVTDDGPLYRFSDNGIGIEPRDQPRIFDLFTRAHPHSGAPGEGLGLSLALQYTHRHGGTLQVQSQPGVGSTFILHFPLAPGMV